MSTEDAELPEDRVRLVGFKDALGSVGDTTAPREIVPVNPLRLVSVTVEVDEELCVMEIDDGEAETLKLGVVEPAFTMFEVEWSSWFPLGSMKKNP